MAELPVGFANRGNKSDNLMQDKMNLAKQHQALLEYGGTERNRSVYQGRGQGAVFATGGGGAR